MIKVLAFIEHPTELPGFSPSLDPLAAPFRLTRNEVRSLDGEEPSPLPLTAIDVAYFADPAHLERFRAAMASTGEHGDGEDRWRFGQVTAEVTLRGTDWLADRWIDRLPRSKHIALARRAEGLTPAEFAERWRAHAGTAGSAPIPEELQGLAYVQNHPVPGGSEVRFDAVNEVWFDDDGALHARHRWLTERVGRSSAGSNDRNGAADDGLFGERHLLIVDEQVVKVRR